MVVKHNLTAMNNERCLSAITGREAKRSEKLSSGYRINRAADDAAGLSISEKMRKQIRGLTQASANAQDGISLCQTAEGALNEVHYMLQRMNELAVQAANGTKSDQDRAYLQDEVAKIIAEVNRVATSTKFNEVYLLDGSCGTPDTEKTSATTATASPKIVFFDEVIHDVIATQSPQHPPFLAGEEAEWGTLKTVLKEEIVPQAVNSLLTTFSNTFGYLNGSEIGIGLQVNGNGGSLTLAAVKMTAYGTNTTPAIVDLMYSLEVNTTFFLDANNNYELTPVGRTNLESTIVHEMMHALMDEALTVGMLGVDQNFDPIEGFPDWFVEGIAQAAGGGVDNIRISLQIDSTSSIADVQAALGGNHRLGSGTIGSQYTTGYLAAMYLGYLASGANSMAALDVSAGLDQLLNDVRGGKSLDQAIADNTGNRYTGIDDFETKFAQDGATFVQQLLIDAGMGRGALVAGDYQEGDILVDTPLDLGLFRLNTDYTVVKNVYPTDYIVMSGGGATSAGLAGPDHPNATTGTGGNGGTGGNTGGTTPGGNTGSGTGTGGTTPGGNTGGGTGTGGTTPGTGGGNTGGTTPGTGGGNTGGAAGGTTIAGGRGRSSRSGGLSLHIGSEADENMIIHIEAMNSARLGIEEVGIGTQEGATNAITIVGEAIHRVSTQRSAIGAYQNRLEHTVLNLDNVIENTQAAESQIRDTDMAKEMVEFSNLKILRQVGQAMLAQTKQYNQDVLALLA